MKEKVLVFWACRYSNHWSICLRMHSAGADTDLMRGGGGGGGGGRGGGRIDQVQM